MAGIEAVKFDISIPTVEEQRVYAETPVSELFEGFNAEVERVLNNAGGYTSAVIPSSENVTRAQLIRHSSRCEQRRELIVGRSTRVMDNEGRFLHDWYKDYGTEIVVGTHLSSADPERHSPEDLVVPTLDVKYSVFTPVPMMLRREFGLVNRFPARLVDDVQHGKTCAFEISATPDADGEDDGEDPYRTSASTSAKVAVGLATAALSRIQPLSTES